MERTFVKSRIERITILRRNVASLQSLSLFHCYVSQSLSLQLLLIVFLYTLQNTCPQRRHIICDITANTPHTDLTCRHAHIARLQLRCEHIWAPKPPHMHRFKWNVCDFKLLHLLPYACCRLTTTDSVHREARQFNIRLKARWKFSQFWFTRKC